MTKTRQLFYVFAANPGFIEIPNNSILAIYVCVDHQVETLLREGVEIATDSV